MKPMTSETLQQRALCGQAEAVLENLGRSQSLPSCLSLSIEEIIEPYLIQQGLVNRTPRGRILTAAAFAHLGLPLPKGGVAGQTGLFDEDDAI